MATSYCPQFIGRIDIIHWDTDPGLIDVDTGERRSAQLQHVVGTLKDHDPAPMAVPAASPAPPAAEGHPGIWVVYGV